MKTVNWVWYLGGIVVSVYKTLIEITNDPEYSHANYLRKAEPSYDWDISLSVNGTVEYLGYKSGELCARVSFS